jgi:hypothetical protein
MKRILRDRIEETLVLRLPPDVDLRQTLKSILSRSLEKAEGACRLGRVHSVPIDYHSEQSSN